MEEYETTYELDGNQELADYIGVNIDDVDSLPVLIKYRTDEASATHVPYGDTFVRLPDSTDIEIYSINIKANDKFYEVSDFIENNTKDYWTTCIMEQIQ